MVEPRTNYLKLPGSIPHGSTIGTCSTVCFRYIKSVAGATYRIILKLLNINLC